MTTEERARRVADRIKEELAVLLQREVSDPRLSMLTITEVDVDRELAFARIYVTALGGEERKDDVLRALKGASGFMRSSLAANIRLRTFPQLRFFWDSSTERGARIDELLDMLKDEHSDEDEASDDE